MARRTPQMALQILLDRICGTPQSETAKKIGIKNSETVSRIIKELHIDLIASEIRLALGIQQTEVSAETVEINSEYDKNLKRTSELIDQVVSDLEIAINDKNSRLSHYETVQTLGMVITAQERARAARLNIAGTRKTDKEDTQESSAFDDLLDEE